MAVLATRVLSFPYGPYALELLLWPLHPSFTPQSSFKQTDEDVILHNGRRIGTPATMAAGRAHDTRNRLKRSIWSVRHKSAMVARRGYGVSWVTSVVHEVSTILQPL